MQAIEAKLTTDRTVRLGTVTVGGSRPILIAGPCAVEPDYVEAAGRLAALGVDVLRGCVFKPRTRPASFQGMGEAGPEPLARARSRTGWPVGTGAPTAEALPRAA